LKPINTFLLLFSNTPWFFLPVQDHLRALWGTLDNGPNGWLEKAKCRRLVNPARLLRQKSILNWLHLEQDEQKGGSLLKMLQLIFAQCSLCYLVLDFAALWQRYPWLNCPRKRSLTKKKNGEEFPTPTQNSS